MRFLQCVLSAVAATVLFLSSPLPCQAWSPSDVVLGFGSTYLNSSGASTVHHGVDIRLAAGAEVAAPCSGEVVFIGNVPAVGGGTVLAASISTENGRVTLLPLQSPRVEVGQRVDTGDAIAELAARGDASSSESHLHLGLRQGSLYKDPSIFLAEVAPERQSNPTPDTVAEPASSSAPSPAASGAAASGAGVAPVVVGAPVGAPAAGAAAAALPEVVVSAPEPASVATRVDGRLQVAEGVSIADPKVAQQGVSPAPASASAGTRLLDAARGALHEPIGLASVLTVVMICGALLSRRMLVRRLLNRELVSDRLGTVLQHMRAGDTLRGLNSCSGHDAFTVPGPPAQRR